MLHKTSTGINFLGIPIVVDYFKKVIRQFPRHKRNIISLGSGGGYIEKILDLLLDLDIICVDPDPLSFIPDKNIYKSPKYQTINDDDFPTDKYKNNCILFINWSSPEQFNGYDIEAIIKLNPECIITITETGVYRGSGSLGFHAFLSFNRIITEGLYNNKLDECSEPERIDFSEHRYFEAGKTTCRYHKPCYEEVLKYEIILLTKQRSSFYFQNILEPYGSPMTINHTDMWKLVSNNIEMSINNLVILPEGTIVESTIDNSWNEYMNEIVNTHKCERRKQKKHGKKR
jgi:hypothetical protein